MRLDRTAIVIGGGIIGITSAYVLARDGWKVSVIEEAPNAAMGASRGNGRQLSYSHTNALASPDLLLSLPSLLLGLNDAFRFTPRLDTRFLKWNVRFLVNCAPSAYRSNTLEVLRLAEESRVALSTLLEQHPIEFERERCGKMVLLSDTAAVENARRMMLTKRNAGLDQRLLSRAEALNIEPALSAARGPLKGVLYALGDETGNCQMFANNLLNVLQKRYDVSFQSDCSVKTLLRRTGSTSVILSNNQAVDCDLAVVANGYKANQLASSIGCKLPIEAMKGYSFVAPIAEASPHVSITDPTRRLVFTRIGSQMLVAGIAEIGKVDPAIDDTRIASMIEAARASMPEAADYDKADEGWAGMRPITPNSQPIIRMVAPGIAVNAGHGMLGWTLAMGSAERLSSMVRATA